MDNKAPKTTLSTNKRLLFLSFYLEYSIRAGAYISNLFFASVITPFLEQISANQFTKSVFVWGYGVLLYEIIWRIINKKYNPKFRKKSEVVIQNLQNTNDLIILEDSDYEYRVKTEKLIKQLGYYYGFQLFISFVLLSLVFVNSQLASNLGLAVFGGFFQIFNFFGIALLSAGISGGVSPKHSLLVMVIGLSFIVPLLIYVACTLNIFYF